MIIEKILKQLTPERVKKEVEAVQKLKLPPELQKWVKEYEKVGERKEFIWKWTYFMWQYLTLPTVTKKYRKSLCITKTSSIILNVLIDDVGDKLKNKNLLEEVWRICFEEKRYKREKEVSFGFSKFSKKEKLYLNLIRKIWNSLNNSIKKYPRYREFKELFFYDYKQFFNSVRYGYLINKNLSFINLDEYQVYFPHNMQAMVGLDLDLMCSPNFKVEKVGCLRKVFILAQQMGRIGNAITTWKREIDEQDFTSDVFAFAIEKKVILLKDLSKEKKDKIITKIQSSSIRTCFLKEWENRYNKIKIIKISKKIKKKLLSGLEKLIFMHLISEGLK